MQVGLTKAVETDVARCVSVYRWSADDAVDYLVRLTGVARSKAQLDVRRIVTFPGQAVAPQYGRLKLDILRRVAQSAIGIIIMTIYFISR